MIKMSEEEFVRRSNERNSIALDMKIPDYYRFPDVKFVKDFLKGVDLDECYFRDNETRHYFPHMFKDSYTPIVESGGQIAFLDTTNMEIRSKDKRLVLNMARPNSTGFAGAIDMVQTTTDGLYWFRLIERMDDASKTSFNCELSYYPSKDLSITGRGYNIVCNDETWNSWMIRQQSFVKSRNLVEEDIAKIANKIYRKGLPYLHELAKAGDVFEITDEDRAYYDEIESIFQTEAVDLDENANEIPTTVSESETSGEIEVIVEKLSALKDIGIELSLEQEDLVDIYEKLHSDKFQQFKDSKEERELRQQEVREEIAAENERKESWYKSPENPSNKRIEELKHMKRQIQGLEALRDIDANLLSDTQNELIEKGNVFFEMMEEAQLQGHEVDTGMSPEIRSWYQEHYTAEESKARK